MCELKQRRSDEDPSINELPSKKRGWPLLLGSELDERVQLFLKQLRELLILQLHDIDMAMICDIQCIVSRLVRKASQLIGNTK